MHSSYSCSSSQLASLQTRVFCFCRSSLHYPVLTASSPSGRRPPNIRQERIMPTLVITGHPCSGKTSFARVLAARALLHPSHAVTSTTILNEESACPGRSKSDCYATSAAEKITREALKSEFGRCCTKSGTVLEGGGSSTKKDGHNKRLVILDSLNYIKGYRYEAHCIAKAAGERHGVVWVLNDPEVCVKWNKTRREKGQKAAEAADWYREDSLIEELMKRYEPPDQRNRWDKPLYKADIASTRAGEATARFDRGDSAGIVLEETSTAAVLSRSLYDMHSLKEAIGSTDDSKREDDSNHGRPKPSSASKSFKRSAAAGFKRNPGRKQIAGAGASRAATVPLTLEALSSLNAEQDGDQSEGTPDETLGSASPIITSAPNNEIVQSPAQNSKVKTLEDIADEILDSFLTGTTRLKEGKSTAIDANAASNVLHDLDNITQEATAALLLAQRNAAALGGGGSGILYVTVGSGEKQITVAVRVNRSAQTTELKRLRRQYVKWSSSHVPDDASENGIATAFLQYVESHL